jgi:hypothetical protein
MKNTSVVVCTYERTLEGGGNKIIVDFKNQNFDNFFVLFDKKNNMSDEEISEHYSKSNICSYDESDFKKYGFDKKIDPNHRWGSNQNPNYFYAHFRMLVFYLKNPNFDHYWFFDDDVTFNGNLKDLLSQYDTDDSDFIAIQSFKKENYLELPKISVINNRMEGSRGYWLNYCPGPGDNFKTVDRHLGCFFPIVRLSKSAMDHLYKLHIEGYYGYSEGFVPTSLASDNFKVSSMMDEFNNFYKENKCCELFHKGINFTWEWL